MFINSEICGSLTWGLWALDGPQMDLNAVLRIFIGK